VQFGHGGWQSCKQVFNIRGQSYLYDDVKVPSDSALFQLRGVQMFKTPSLRSHIINEPWCAFHKHKPHEEWLILNYMVPGNLPLQVITYFTATKEARDAIRNKELSSPLDSEGWQNSLQRFWRAEKSYCDAHFKLIPNVVEGPWAVKMAVGSKPALIGNKLQLHYSRGPGYFEIDIDIGSSPVASRILNMVCYYTHILLLFILMYVYLGT
jgi:hypothetical protein